MTVVTEIHEDFLNELMDNSRHIRKHLERTKTLSDDVKWDRIKNYPIPASNFLDDARSFLPEPGYFWDIGRITVQGFTQGSVAVYYNSIYDEEIFNFTTAGTYLPDKMNVPTFGPATRLVFQATSLTGTAVVSISYLSIKIEKLAKYVMG